MREAMQATSLKIKNVEFGKGIPKICVPIVAKTKIEILKQAKQLQKKEVDCIEIRIDWFEYALDVNKVLEILSEIRAILTDKVLLFTFRTKQEGGEKSISAENYKELCECVAKSGYVDFIDVEAFMDSELLAVLCDTAHQSGVYIIASNHDFAKTPSEEEIIKRLQYMDETGADIPKIAVMPQNERDVLTLLSATLKYRELGGRKPLITMAMGGYGVISRLSGEIFGSAVTFAALEQVSAPGQMNADEVKRILKTIHQSQ